jgi:DNA-binding CsgD family transcriptional regulator
MVLGGRLRMRTTDSGSDADLVPVEDGVRLTNGLCPTCGGKVRVVYRADNKYWDALSERELEIVELLIDLGSAPRVAKKLGLSIQTVKNHLHAVRKKTDTDTMVQALYKLITGG